MSLIISIRFPTERYVAASMSRRDEVEWPPHPARLMLGLLATHYRGDAKACERDALQWLCEQTPPAIMLPPAQHCIMQNMTGVFVPQNPTEAKTISHPRKERSFPSIILPADQAEILFHWSATEPTEEIKKLLAALLSKLVRLGHSSSLAIGSVLEEIPAGDWDRLDPQNADDLSSPAYRLRIPWAGLLESAELAYDANGREAELEAAYSRRDAAAEKGKPLVKFEAAARGRYDARHVTCGYTRQAPMNTHKGPWESGLCVLSRTGGSTLGLESIWQVAAVLHRTILDRWSRQGAYGPVPAWLSGHEVGSGPTAPVRHNHLAILPLAHVDTQHASGRIMGLGLAIPRAETVGVAKSQMRQELRQLLACLFDDGGLKLSPEDHAWHLELSLADGEERRVALQPQRWSDSSTVWKSVTPIILDKHPKPAFAKDPQAWTKSCEDIIADACMKIGLPKPVAVLPSVSSLLAGSPPAPAFVAPSQRPGRPTRYHVHATLVFDENVSGPISIGAGRFRGYGLLKPTISTKI